MGVTQLKEVAPVRLSPEDEARVMRKIIETCRREGYIVVKREKAFEVITSFIHANFPVRNITDLRLKSELAMKRLQEAV
jgi:hypothetical protein